MNKVILIGRLVKDPEVKTTQSQVAFCAFTIAVTRIRKNAAGLHDSDFLSCIAWRQHASFLGQFFFKGMRIAVTGTLQSRSYDDENGKKRYVTEVMVEELEFVDTKKPEQQSAAPIGSQQEVSPPEVVQDESRSLFPQYDEDAPL